MADIGSIGKLLLVAGLVLAGVGLLVMVAGRIPFLGRLPGDIYVQRGNFTFYFPLLTSILLSILLTVLVNLFARRRLPDLTRLAEARHPRHAKRPERESTAAGSWGTTLPSPRAECSAGRGAGSEGDPKNGRG